MDLMALILSRILGISLVYALISLNLFIGYKFFGGKLNKKTLLSLVLFGIYFAVVQIVEDVLKYYDVQEVEFIIKIIKRILMTGLIAELIFVLFIYDKKKN